jgi:hypothetical protein
MPRAPHRPASLAPDNCLDRIAITHPYRMTAAGRNLAITEANRLADVLRLARRRKILRVLMSEKLFRLLLHLYPLHFRDSYGDEALQLFRDEKGPSATLRLWFDLVCDFIVTVPCEYSRPKPAVRVDMLTTKTSTTSLLSRWEKLAISQRSHH